MRRNFAQILKESQIDIKAEYQKLYGMLYDRSIQVSNTKRISVYDELGDYFTGFYFRGTCLTIEEFDMMHGFHFERDPSDFNIDKLISLCEYITNMLIGYQTYLNSCGYMAVVHPNINIQFYMAQISQVIDKIGYMQASQDGVTIYVEKSPAAISVAEIVPESISYKVIFYNHHSMQGKLEEKKQTLLIFANMLEPRRESLEQIDRKFTSDLFYAFNNFNIRHNNTDPESLNYKKPIDNLTKEQLEHWYDEIYQMALLAFLRLEHINRKKDFDDLKEKIEN